MHSAETRKKIGNALRKSIWFKCDYCDAWAYNKPSAYKRKKRHFCCQDCYSKYRAEKLPREEQHAYKNGGLSMEAKKQRLRTRSDLNHAIRDGKIKRKPCEVCGKSAEAHHEDYDKPFEIRWLCKKHHWEIYENPELL